MKLAIKAGDVTGLSISAAMQLKITAFLLVVAVASGQVLLRPGAYGRPLAYGNAPIAIAAPAPLAVARAPLAVARQPLLDEYYDPNPQYEYSYSVDDPLTGDSKTASESRNGDVVQGSYSLIEPDGSRRIVEYTADPASGFNAAVSKEAGGPAIARPALSPAPLALAPAPILAPRRILAPGIAPRPIVSSAYGSPYAQYVL